MRNIIYWNNWLLEYSPLYHLLKQLIIRIFTSSTIWRCFCFESFRRISVWSLLFWLIIFRSDVSILEQNTCISWWFLIILKKSWNTCYFWLKILVWLSKWILICLLLFYLSMNEIWYTHFSFKNSNSFISSSFSINVLIFVWLLSIQYTDKSNNFK